MRYLFGVRGPALVAGAIGPTATRTDPEDIEDYLAESCPCSTSISTGTSIR